VFDCPTSNFKSWVAAVLNATYTRNMVVALPFAYQRCGQLASAKPGVKQLFFLCSSNFALSCFSFREHKSLASSRAPFMLSIRISMWNLLCSQPCRWEVVSCTCSWNWCARTATQPCLFRQLQLSLHHHPVLLPLHHPVLLSRQQLRFQN
jgi:hypothetical protein